jgi:hypothetical protein
MVDTKFIIKIKLVIIHNIDLIVDQFILYSIFNSATYFVQYFHYSIQMFEFLQVLAYLR